MIVRITRLRIIIASAILLTLVGLGPVLAQQDNLQPVYLRLKVATFDPLVAEPAVESNLRVEAYPKNGEGPYIVQFQGPIQDGWRDRIQALGGRVAGYLPDYAFLVCGWTEK
jgi:hypothetical protein